MASIDSALLVHCQMALGFTQQQLADLLGCTKRTVQRWEDKGATLLPSGIEALAHALYPVRPDLAEQVAAAGDTTLEQIGVPSVAAAGGTPISEPIEAIVRSAAEAIGVTQEVVRPAVATAFAKAREAGLDVQAIATYLQAIVDRST
jgi:transcriptional regulator with XRE-family HTH domain